VANEKNMIIFSCAKQLINRKTENTTLSRQRKKNNRKILESDKIGITYTNMHARSHSCLDRDLSIQSDGIKLHV
jgi:hypothetical protein